MHVEIIFSPERKEKSAGCYFILGLLSLLDCRSRLVALALGFLFAAAAARQR